MPVYHDAYSYITLFAASLLFSLITVVLLHFPKSRTGSLYTSRWRNVRLFKFNTCTLHHAQTKLQ